MYKGKPWALALTTDYLTHLEDYSCLNIWKLSSCFSDLDTDTETTYFESMTSAWIWKCILEFFNFSMVSSIKLWVALNLIWSEYQFFFKSKIHKPINSHVHNTCKSMYTATHQYLPLTLYSNRLPNDTFCNNTFMCYVLYQLFCTHF